jgi:hypothetical protein
MILDDTYALIKFSNFVLNRWRANGDSLGTGGSPNVNYSTHYIKLIVPAGTYNIAKQISIAPGTPLDSFYTWSTSSSVAVKKIPYSILFANAGNNSDGLYVTVVKNGCATPNIYATKRFVSLPNIDITQANGVTSNAVDGIHIVANGAIFKYADSIRQGFIGPNGNAMVPDSSSCYGAYWSLYHSDYDALRFYNCNNIMVEGLEVDGNNVNALYMGPAIDYFQGGATAIFLGASKNFTIKNCYLHNMSLDGLRIIDTFCESATKGEIRNVRCEYNFRQGLTWSEGDSVAIDSCSFSYTGRAVSNITGIEISSSPAAGIDIEYDGVCRMPGQLYVCKRGYFKHCKFSHNLGFSVENTYRYHTPFDSIVRSLDMNFDSCKFITNGGSNRALSVYGRKYSFTHCDIQGCVQNGYLGDSTDGGFSFDACKFTDYNDSGAVWRSNGQFFDCTSITYPKITNCSFHINGAYNKLGYINWNSPIAAKHSLVWRNNLVVYDSCDANTTDYLSQLAVSGVNSFSSNAGYTANSFRTIGFKYCNVLGDTSTSCTRDTLQFAGPILHALFYTTPDSFVLGTAAAGTGRVDYVLQDSAMQHQQSSDGILLIRPNARFIVAPSAGVYGLGKTHNLGAYIHSAGSYLAHEGAQFLSSGSNNARFYIPNGVNPQLERCNPYWITAAGYVFANNNKWINTYNIIQPCVQGNNQADFWSNAISKLPACNPVYNNINVQQFDISYKLLPATCNQYDSVQLDVHGSNGSISRMADGTALPSAQYIGTHTAYITGMAAGVHTITVTDAAACSHQFTVNLSGLKAIPSMALASIGHVGCNGQASGSCTTQVTTGAIAPYTFAWSNGATDSTLSNLSAGSYTCTATDANGCTASTTITITEPPALSFATPTITHVACNGASTGAVALSASGGTGTISITPTQTTLAAATYTFTATDANGCIATTTITITEPPALSFAAPTITDVTCHGASTGAVALSASGGTGTISITPAQTNLAATTYTFTATDANGCTASTTITITEPPAISFAAPTITHVTCNGASTGEVVLNASGGTGNINIPGQTTTLTAGTYSFTATDANNCTSTISISITQPSALQLTLNAYNESCGLAGSGRIEYVVDGGVTPYSLICSNSYSNAPAANTTYTIGPIAQGTYSTTLEDANGCIAESINTLYTPTTAMCACTNGELILEAANTILLQNPSTSTINTQFANAGTVSNKRFYIDGVLTIDQNITFDNCELYFTQLASVFNGSSHTLTLNYSTLDAACDTWVGIIASGANAKVIGNNSTWRHANVGIDATQNALVELDQCTFEDGGTGIILEDATANPYPISIERCVFTTTPTVTPTTHMIGIHIEDIVHANIGDKLDASSGNSFANLEIGVHISNENPSCQVGIYNCTFDNIHDRSITGMWQHATKVNNCYTQKSGAAIWCKTKELSLGNTSVEVANTNAANANTAISNCDKGIVGLRSNATVRNVYIANTLMGVMLGASTGRDIDVQHCAVNNAFIGVQCSGNTSNLVIEDNTIDISTSGINTGLYSMIWPIGIDVKSFLNQTNDPAIIAGNTVNLQGFSGVGINADNTNKMTNIELNTINIGYTSSEDIVCINASHLTGISARNVYGTQLQGNHINAPASMIGGTRTDISGILLDNSSQQQLHCNHSLNTPVSITVISECLTPADKVKGNEANSAKFGWLFRHLGTEASFGDVGDANNDNNNLFVGTTFASKVFRFCELAPQYQIFTAPSNLVLSESNSEDINSGSSNTCVYYTAANAIGHSTYTCPSVYSITTSGGSGGETYFTLAEALAIAADVRQYAEFEDMAYWIDCRKLYYQLVADPVLRNSHTALLAFYNTMQSNVINEQRQADVALRNYISSFYANNEALLEQMRLAAENENDDIDNTEVQNNNDKQINAAYLTVSRLGLEGLSAAELGFVTALANNCPYIAGPAVYKAREINTLLQPARIYDDLKECNTQGVFRLADTSAKLAPAITNFSRENSFLSTTSPKQQYTKTPECLVYPNPSTGEFNVLLDTEYAIKTISIYNAIGDLIETKSCSIGINTAKFNLSGQAQGMYSYKVTTYGGYVFTGKIILQ